MNTDTFSKLFKEKICSYNSRDLLDKYNYSGSIMKYFEVK